MQTRFSAMPATPATSRPWPPAMPSPASHAQRHPGFLLSIYDLTPHDPGSAMIVSRTCCILSKSGVALLTLAHCWLQAVGARVEESRAVDLGSVARQYAPVHRFSTLFTASDVRDRLSTPQGLGEAIDWCRQTAVTQVYVETFRDGYQAERTTLENARDRLREAGLEVSGCVTTTRVGKQSTGWNVMSCTTDAATQQRLREIFEFTAGLFGEIMIDDFWFVDCTCQACESARQARRVTIGDRSWPVDGDSWEAYRCELMVRLSQEVVLAAARRVNPGVRLILKYPQWYDRFHERGYEVLRQTRDFDRIWVGTETRDYDDERWGGTVQYEAYFIMRWLGGLGGARCGGGWYDWLGTTEATYLEQARQTILAGARESMLFCYGGLQRDTGPANIAALRRHIPELLRVAAEVHQRRPVGMAAYKPPNSHPGNESRVFDFVGMLGIPLVPCHEFPVDAPAAFLSFHALKDPELISHLERFLPTRRPLLITDGLAEALSGKIALNQSHVRVLPVRGDPQSLLQLGTDDLSALRNDLLPAVQHTFVAPNQVGLYLFHDGSWVIENFNNSPANTQLDGQSRSVPPRSWIYEWR